MIPKKKVYQATGPIFKNQLTGTKVFFPGLTLIMGLEMLKLFLILVLNWTNFQKSVDRNQSFFWPYVNRGPGNVEIVPNFGPKMDQFSKINWLEPKFFPGLTLIPALGMLKLFLILVLKWTNFQKSVDRNQSFFSWPYVNHGPGNVEIVPNLGQFIVCQLELCLSVF